MPRRQRGPCTPRTRSVEAAHAAAAWQVWGTAGKDERYVLFKPETVRRRAAEGNPLSRKFADEFCIRWRQYTAFIGQQMMRGPCLQALHVHVMNWKWKRSILHGPPTVASALTPEKSLRESVSVGWWGPGHYSTLTRVSRRELVLIKRLKRHQEQMSQKAIALFVTVGITLGQFLLGLLMQQGYISLE